MKEELDGYRFFHLGVLQPLVGGLFCPDCALKQMFLKGRVKLPILLSNVSVAILLVSTHHQ